MTGIDGSRGTGLRTYARDTSLPLRLDANEPLLPGDDELLELLADLPGVPAVAAVRLEHARWKPGVSVTGAWRLTLADGGHELLSLKRYVGDKADALAERLVGEPEPATDTPLGIGLLPLPARREVLWEPAADRLLPGIARATGPGCPRLVARLVHSSGAFESVLPGARVRKRRSTSTLLRYKPERRGVFALDLGLRGEDGAKARAKALLRVLPPDEGAAVALRRARFAELGGAQLGPPLLGAVPHLGILLEGWLEGAAAAPDDLTGAARAGRALAALHRVPAPDAEPVVTRPGELLAGLRSLFAIDASLEAQLVELAALLPAALEPIAPTWIHGDFHPDQVFTLADGSVRLIDHDLLRQGDPRLDLASWLADELLQHPEAASDLGRSALLAGYGERAPVPPRLEVLVAANLAARAGAALRRLEHDAIARATTCLATALALLGADAAGALPRAASVTLLERALVAVAPHLAPGERVERIGAAGSPGPGGQPTAAHVHVAGDAGRRCYRLEDAALRPLAPEDDDRIPLLARPGRAGDLLAWRPGRRAVRRVERDGVVSILKGYRRRRSGPAAARHELACRACGAPGGFRVPELLHHDPETSTLELALLAGDPLSLSADAAADFHRLGVALRVLQDHAGPGLELLDDHDHDAELAVVRTMAERARAVTGGPSAAWTRELERLAAARADLPEPPRVLTHRDLHDGQVLRTDERIGLLDFDLLCRADPALDPANLRAHLTLRLLQGLGGATVVGAAACQDALLEGYGPDTGAEPARRAAFYLSATFLRLAVVYDPRPPWRHLTPRLIELARASTDSLDR